MRARWWLIALGSVWGLLVVCCLLAVLVGLPEFRENVRTAMREAFSTEIARQLPATPAVGVPPGDYEITQEELQASIEANADENDVENLIVRITPEHIALSLRSRGQNATYTGTPIAQDGQLVMRDMEVSSRVLGFILPAGDLAQAIEDAVNEYLAQNGLRLAAIELLDGSMILRAVTA